jgi:hypothetical protein
MGSIHKQLVFLVAFGADCLELFKVCLIGLSKCEVDIVLITDQYFFDERIKVIQYASPPDRSHIYSYRTRVKEHIDISPYEQIWYLDTDFVIKGDLFSRYAGNENLLLNIEPDSKISNEHFCADLTGFERDLYKDVDAINAGIYCVPKRYFSFFDYYDFQVKQAWIKKPEMKIPEQQCLNTIYLRWHDVWQMEAIEGIGYPAHGTDGIILHYACYPNGDKLKLMQDEINKQQD